ncbi:CHRD domain-containing protein [Methylobacterium sp. WL122]|nr:CHRD domain-containing protein [Methylobacterium sp. WL122]
MIRDIHSGLAALALSAFALSATVATASAAEGQTYKAALTAGSEVPATESKGTGEVSATYDPAGKTLTWKGSYSGLTGPVTAAHFHGPAEAGANAGVLVPVTASASAAASARPTRRPKLTLAVTTRWPSTTMSPSTAALARPRMRSVSPCTRRCSRRLSA